MIAPASVPQVMIVASFHHIVVSPPRFGSSSQLARYVSATDTNEVSHTRLVSGFSKSMCAAPANLAVAMPSLTK